MVQDEDELSRISLTQNDALYRSKRPREAETFLVHLPPAPILEELVKIFFTEYDWQYLTAEKYYFDELYRCWRTTEPPPLLHLTRQEATQELRYFPGLLFQIAALAIQVMPQDASVLSRMTEDQLRSAQRYSDIGMEFMEVSRRHGFALTAVQATILRCSWLKNIGRSVNSWHELSAAIRLAVNSTL